MKREEFVVVGWTDPEGSRPHLGALLLGYCDSNGRLVYAGRVGSGINIAELQRLWRRLQPLAADKMPLGLPPPRSARFGSLLVLSRVHSVRSEFVAEVKFLAWTEDNLLRQVEVPRARTWTEPVRAKYRSWIQQNHRFQMHDDKVGKSDLGRTFAGTRGNDEDAPIAALSRTPIEPPDSALVAAAINARQEVIR